MTLRTTPDARLHAGTTSDIRGIKRQTVNLSHMASEVLARHNAAEPARRVAWCIAPDLVLHADPELLRILLENLIGNAWKFTATRDLASIEVGCRVEDGDDIYFIRDDGAGFDMTHVGNLFQPFQRLHTRSDFPGSGIGLTIVRRMIRFHGGRIWTESGGGTGARFHFSLTPPVAKPVLTTQGATRTVRMPMLAQEGAGQE